MLPKSCLTFWGRGVCVIGHVKLWKHWPRVLTWSFEIGYPVVPSLAAHRSSNEPNTFSWLSKNSSIGVLRSTWARVRMQLRSTLRLTVE